MARADKDPIRRDRAERVKTAILRVWENRGGETLSITRGARRLEFYRPPDVITDADGEVIGVDAWVRLYNVNTGAEIRIDPHRRIINPPTVPRAGIRDVPDPTPDEPGRTRRELIVDAAEAFVEAVVDSIQDAPNPKGWRTAGTVTTVFSSTADGTIQSVSGTSAALARSGTSLTTDTTSTTDNVGLRFASGPQWLAWEAFLSFDTSAISDTDVVSAVDLAVWLVADLSATDFTLEAREKDWGVSLTTADWVAGGSITGLPLLASLATSGIGATGAYKTLTSQAAFLTATNLKTGTVYVMLNSSSHYGADNYGDNRYIQISMADNTGTTQDPKLTLTHAAPVTAPPVFRNRPARIWRRY